MSSPLNKKTLIEAALYAAGRPLSLEDLEKISKASGRSEAESLLNELVKEYQGKSGALEIVEVSKGRYALQLKPEYSSKVSRLSPGGLLRLGQLKTLALIAVRQPIKQSEVINIRGAHSYEYIHRLDQLGFIKREPSGRTTIITTSKMFAEYFGFDEDLRKLKLQLHRKLVKLNVQGETGHNITEEQATETEEEKEKVPE